MRILRITNKQINEIRHKKWINCGLYFSIVYFLFPFDAVCVFVSVQKKLTQVRSVNAGFKPAQEFRLMHMQTIANIIVETEDGSHIWHLF